MQAPRRAAAQPEISGEDLDLILFLVNELRQELTDKNVRLAPVEEELNALKARSTNVSTSIHRPQNLTISLRVRVVERVTTAGPPLNICHAVYCSM